MKQVNNDDNKNTQYSVNPISVQSKDDDHNEQKNDNNAQVTVRPTGSVESAPASVEKPEQSVESYVQVSESHPEISEEEKKAGVKIVRGPKVSDDAKRAGVEESVPVGPNYNISFSSKGEAKSDFEKGDINKAGKWRALIAFKEFAKNLIGSGVPQESH